MELSRALGVDLVLPGPVLGLPPVPNGAGDRQATIEVIPGLGPDTIIGGAGTRRSIDRKAENGVDRVLTLDVNPTHGYRIWATGFGAFHVSADGSSVLCSPETEDAALWQRFLIGQILPFVSVLQGIEVMHGSAVALDGRAVAVMGGSGAGKTSIAARLLLGGAVLMTDDVVALERRGEELIVHPGPAILGVRHEEFAALSDGEAGLLGSQVAENEKEIVFSVAREQSTLPLAGVYFIVRDAEATQLAFSPSDDATPILASSFNTVVGGRPRFERMLDVFAQVPKCAQVFWVTIPRNVDAGTVAAALEEHAATHMPQFEQPAHA